MQDRGRVEGEVKERDEANGDPSPPGRGASGSDGLFEAAVVVRLGSVFHGHRRVLISGSPLGWGTDSQSTKSAAHVRRRVLFLFFRLSDA